MNRNALPGKYYMIYTIPNASFSLVDSSCTLSVDSGPCKAAHLKWYYSKDTESCELFKYGGCAGNGNRFNTEYECRTACRPEGNHF